MVFFKVGLFFLKDFQNSIEFCILCNLVLFVRKKEFAFWNLNLRVVVDEFVSLGKVF